MEDAGDVVDIVRISTGKCEDEAREKVLISLILVTSVSIKHYMMTNKNRLKNRHRDDS